MKECNECVNRKCDVVRLFRKGRVIQDKQIVDMSASCSKFVPPKVWKTKLLFLAIHSNVQGLHDALRGHKLWIQELADKPYFRIILEE